MFDSLSSGIDHEASAAEISKITNPKYLEELEKYKNAVFEVSRKITSLP